jgi:hypothetical protein
VAAIPVVAGRKPALILARVTLVPGIVPHEVNILEIGKPSPDGLSGFSLVTRRDFDEGP